MYKVRYSKLNCVELGVFLIFTALTKYKQPNKIVENIMSIRQLNCLILLLIISLVNRSAFAFDDDSDKHGMFVLEQMLSELDDLEDDEIAYSVNTGITEKDFTLFETGQVRPLALSNNGQLLYALNTPDNRVEIYKIRVRRGKVKLKHLSSVFVGLEPTALALNHNNKELWVVNHLSDSVSIVDVRQPRFPFVKETLLVGDEPRDIVFAGSKKDKAFITSAHRGQNIGFDPQLTTPGVGRADVWVFQAKRRANIIKPVTVITLFADTPRALAVSQDGSKVYVAAFHSGNRTTVINERLVTNFGGLPAPTENAQAVTAPDAGLIVKFRPHPDTGEQHWLDEENRIWDDQVNFNLPDRDVFVIDANQEVPTQVSSISGVGTVLFNMVVHPQSGKVYVSNTEARNNVRFEGHNLLGGRSTVRGNIARNQISIVDTVEEKVLARHLNKHIDYAKDGNPEETAKSLAFPLQMVFSLSGEELFVAGFGSGKIVRYRSAELESDQFEPKLDDQIKLSAGGPTGLAYLEKRKLLFVLTRFDNGISIVNTETMREIGHVRMFNPEPQSIVRGRQFLYDAQLTSSHGDSACASCHVFGDTDSLAWDLGDPDGFVQDNPGPFVVPLSFFPGAPDPDLHPMKGPMATQSLRGMANHGSMHWRGDRRENPDNPSVQPDLGAFNEQAAFEAFNVAFPGLLGRASPLSAEQIKQFADFALQITYPPNPIRNLDNSLTLDQQAGRDFYFNTLPDGTPIPSDTTNNCNGCHVLDLDGNREHDVFRPGFFGTDGRFSFESEPQMMKVPHLRNMYQKIGMFGMSSTWALPIDGLIPRLSFLPAPLNNDEHMGDQIRGFGFTHDGSVDSLFRFFGANVFVQRGADSAFPNPGGIPADEQGLLLRRQLESFILAFDSNLAPIVGQQITLNKKSTKEQIQRVRLMQARAKQGENDVIAKVRIGPLMVGLLYEPNQRVYMLRPNGVWRLRLKRLIKVARAYPVTFTSVPLKQGLRMGLDRELDGQIDLYTQRDGDNFY